MIIIRRRHLNKLFFLSVIIFVFFIGIINYSNYESNGISRIFFNSVKNLVTISSNDNDIKRGITDIVHYQNRAQIIHNLELFGPVTNQTVLITLQVHNRISYLKNLIDSLRRSSNISEALIIVSHDIYNDQINDVILSIDFCMVMQIFLPFSNQLNPLTFPGDDPNDCERNDSMIEAEAKRCNNWKYPDSYGHYREAKYTQMKHHWWWKLNRIFDELEATKYYQGFLLLLEEDYYVAEDFIHVFKLLQNTVKESDLVNVIVLGAYESTINSVNYNSFDTLSWKTDRHNMAMSFNRTTWNAVKTCAKYFCEYDEYNYDFSLQNVNMKCLQNKLITNAMSGPRVYHIGYCGVHQTSNKCESDDKILQMEKHLQRAKSKKLLYPKFLRGRDFSTSLSTLTLTNNGGWGDLRDQKLCMQMAGES